MDDSRLPILNQFIYPSDLIDIINDYADDYHQEPSAVKSLTEKKQMPVTKDKQEQLITSDSRRFTYFYKKKNLLNNLLEKENPFKLSSEELLLKKVFK